MKVAAAALAGALLASTSVYAGQFTGTLSLNGTNSFTDHSVTFVGAGNIGASSGDLAALGSCFNCVALTSFDNTSTNFSPYDASNDGRESAITLSSVVFTFVSGVLDNLTVTGVGIATLTGFDPTAGFFSLTTQGNAGAALTQGNAGEVTWSSTTIASAVPEPGTLALIGAALMGIWFARRRKGEIRQPPDCASAL